MCRHLFFSVLHSAKMLFRSMGAVRVMRHMRHFTCCVFVQTAQSRHSMPQHWCYLFILFYMAYNVMVII